MFYYNDFSFTSAVVMPTPVSTPLPFNLSSLSAGMNNESHVFILLILCEQTAHVTCVSGHVT